MTRCLRALLWPCLLLVGCDKRGSSDAHIDEPTSTAQAPRPKHAPRAPTPDKPAELRSILETALNIESPADREKAVADVAWNAIEIDPELAHEAFQKLPADSPQKIRLIQHYAMRLAEQNPDEALEWATALPTEQEVAVAKGQIALAIAETDPRHAANLLSESGIDGREFEVAVVQVIQRWAAKSAPDAANWVVLFPPGAAREAGMQIIAGKWLPSDASAAFGWLDTLQDEALRKEALRAMEGVILQQPQKIRETWLEHADTGTRSELEQQREQALKDVGDNVPEP